MKAARVHNYADHPLHVDDVPEPTIQSPFDVIVRIGGAGVCRTDLHDLEQGRIQGRAVLVPS